MRKIVNSGSVVPTSAAIKCGLDCIPNSPMTGGPPPTSANTMIVIAPPGIAVYTHRNQSRCRTAPT